jgi:hypothetical protein
MIQCSPSTKKTGGEKKRLIPKYYAALDSGAAMKGLNVRIIPRNSMTFRRKNTI